MGKILRALIVTLCLSLIFTGAAVFYYLAPAETFAQAGGFTPEDPTALETSLFNAKKARIEANKDQWPHDVTDVLNSFSQPVTKSFNCPAGSKVNKVTVTITTKLVKWNVAGATEARGCYIWKATILLKPVANGGGLTEKLVECTNYLMLEPTVAQQEEQGGEFTRILDEALLYHELLHGQLLIDAMDTPAWQQKMCNCEFDLGPTDSEHKVVPALERQYINSVAAAKGYQVIEQTVTATADEAGNFQTTIDLPRKRDLKCIVIVCPYTGNIASISSDVQIEDMTVSGNLTDPSQVGKFDVIIDPPLEVIIVHVEVSSSGGPVAFIGGQVAPVNRFHLLLPWVIATLIIITSVLLWVWSRRPAKESNKGR